MPENPNVLKPAFKPANFQCTNPECRYTASVLVGQQETGYQTHQMWCPECDSEVLWQPKAQEKRKKNAEKRERELANANR